MDTSQSGIRDIFLSHRSIDKDFVRLLAGDIETIPYASRTLLAWLDEAEIRAGQSIPAEIEKGLQNSRYIGLILTPEYFNSPSGWTDAEWHAMIGADPDNRRARILPILAESCPFIPFLLRHLKMIDMRRDLYDRGFDELIAVLTDQPLKRPTSARGQLVTPGGMIDRASLMAERSVPQSLPDAVVEKLYSNLLPVERLPTHLYISPIASGLLKERKDGSKAIPSKQTLKEAINQYQKDNDLPVYNPSFRVFEGNIWTFHDLADPLSPFLAVVENEATEAFTTKELMVDEDFRRVVISLLNMSISRHMHRCGLTSDNELFNRFHFSAIDANERTISWIPNKKRSSRAVAKPYVRNDKVEFWRHQAAYLKVLFLANKLYLQISPTWVITDDGHNVRRGPQIGLIVSRWTSPERNLHVLYHVRFWTHVMRRDKPGPIYVYAGDQSIEIGTNPAYIQQSYGVSRDQKDLIGMLDQEDDEILIIEEEFDEQLIRSTTRIEEDTDSEWISSELESPVELEDE